MIVPSIDLRRGSAVQLVEGKTLALDAGDPFAVAERFAVAGRLAVIDLDAAFGEGHNRPIVHELVRRYPCDVGGGVRSVEAALDLLDAGAERVILGTAASPDLLSQLPRRRVVAALDNRRGEVVVEGWRTATGQSLFERIEALRDHVGGFLVTFVEREGRMAGFDWELVERVVAAAGDAQVTIAGGCRSAEDVARADDLGADVQVGMALYTGALDLGDAIAAPLRPRADALVPTVVCDEHSVALGLAWSTRQSLREAVRTRTGVYWSRSRNALWRKGETSGAVQRLLRVDLDCDRDALRFTVRQSPPGFCHRGSWSCFGRGAGIAALSRALEERLQSPPPGSYTARLCSDPQLLRRKLLEEAAELAEAATREEACAESADVLYHALVAAQARGVSLAEIERELDRRALRVRRRGEGAQRESTP